MVRFGAFEALAMALVAGAIAACSHSGVPASITEASCEGTVPVAGPWFATVAPSEAGNRSGRSHFYEAACTSVSDERPPRVAALQGGLPGLYNVATREPDELFALGGTLGPITVGNAPYVVGLDPQRLSERWRTRLPGPANGDWNYPGAAGVHRNGDIYVVYSRFIARLDPGTGAVKAHSLLPTNQAGRDVGYNGFVILSDGRIAAKSIHRKPGCEEPDIKAFLKCTATGMAASTLAIVNPDTMAVEQSLVLPEHVRYRITAASVDGIEYLYLPGDSRIHRVRYAQERLTLDESWQPQYLGPGQTPGTAVAAMGDWVVIQTNGIPAAVPLSVIAISQRDPAHRHRIEPFHGESGKGSFALSMPTVDISQGRVYTFDGFAGHAAALDFDPKKGFTIAWKQQQRSFGFSSLLGPADRRVLISTDIGGISSWLFGLLPFETKLARTRDPQLPQEDIVWRDAASGQELGRVTGVAAVAGAVAAPGFNGSFFAPDLLEARLVRMAAQGR